MDKKRVKAHSKKTGIKNKRAQESIGISFGMIVAIILVVIFIIVAIIVIVSLLKTQNCAKVGIFVKNINDKVESAWNSDGASFEFKGDLPKDLKKVCFGNLNENLKGPIGEALETLDHEDNLFFYPTGKACGMASYKIAAEDGSNDLNIPEIIKKYGNPFCIDVIDGKIKFKIVIENGEKLVRIER